MRQHIGHSTVGYIYLNSLRINSPQQANSTPGRTPRKVIKAVSFYSHAPSIWLKTENHWQEMLVHMSGTEGLDFWWQMLPTRAEVTSLTDGSIQKGDSHESLGETVFPRGGKHQ